MAEKDIHFQFYPSDIEYIDNILESYDIDHGYVSWEYGNRLIFLSRVKLTMIHFHKVKPLHVWINQNWIDKNQNYKSNSWETDTLSKRIIL